MIEPSVKPNLRLLIYPCHRLACGTRSEGLHPRTNHGMLWAWSSTLDTATQALILHFTHREAPRQSARNATSALPLRKLLASQCPRVSLTVNDVCLTSLFFVRLIQPVS